MRMRICMRICIGTCKHSCALQAPLPHLGLAWQGPVASTPEEPCATAAAMKLASCSASKGLTEVSCKLLYDKELSYRHSGRSSATASFSLSSMSSRATRLVAAICRTKAGAGFVSG